MIHFESFFRSFSVPSGSRTPGSLGSLQRPRAIRVPKASCSPIAASLSIVICLAITIGIPVAQAAPLDWQLDPHTGNAVAQLTAWDSGSTGLTQNNYALYYHQPNQSQEGQFLVYQHSECGCNATGCGTSPSTVEYHSVDLETGLETQLTGTGLANGAVVHGSHLYVVTRTSPSQAYQYIERIDLESSISSCLTRIPTGELFKGSMTVNADGTILIYQTRPQVSGAKGGGTWAHFIGPNPPSVCPDSPPDTLLHAYDEDVEHIQFSPVDPKAFTFFDGRGRELEELGIGTVTTLGSTWNLLSSTDPYFDSFYGFPHPFWDADGSLWTDVIGPSASTGLSEAFVRLDIDLNSGSVTSYAAVDMEDDDWHHHQVGGRSTGWFVGDGLNIVSRQAFGEPWISLFHLDPPTSPSTSGGTLERFRIADSLGAENSGRGNGGANSHFLKTLDGVVFTAPYDLATGEAAGVSGCPASRNVFLAKIPPPLKARLRDAVVITGEADGPFKHANRLAVSSDGQSWSVDYGSGGAQPTIGDGVVDRVGGSITGGSISGNHLSPGTAHAALADLNGDGVDDRLMLTSIWSGGWSIDAAYTPYDGVLPTGNAAGAISRIYPGPSSPHPVFGDLDADGRDDLIFLDVQGTAVLWQGRFSANKYLPAYPYVSFGLPWETASAFGVSNLDQHFFVSDVNGDGYGDRVAVRPQGAGWRWSVDYSTPSGFGDGVEDSFFVGGSNSSDTPLMADVNLDGRADIVIAREQGTQYRWFVNPSTAVGFGNAWDPPYGRGFFGTVGQPLIGTFGRFHTVQP